MRSRVVTLLLVAGFAVSGGGAAVLAAKGGDGNGNGHNNAGNSQYKPGKGCGDKNRDHTGPPGNPGNTDCPPQAGKKDKGEVRGLPLDKDADGKSDDAGSSPTGDSQAAAVETDTSAEGSSVLPFTGHNLMTALWLGVLVLLAGVGLRAVAGQGLLRRDRP